MVLPKGVDGLLRRYLRLWKPRTLLGLSFAPIGAIDKYLETQARCTFHMVVAAKGLAPLKQLGRFDLAVVTNQLEHLPKRRGVELLGRLKNLHTHRILLAINLAKCDGWSRNDLIGLGFLEPKQAGAVSPVRFFYYDLASYNPKRGWNNSRFWAHPENFDKFRW